jgi:hypothetical protein
MGSVNASQDWKKDFELV